jgi:peptide methionine sulfoxide reductase MsrB
MAKKQITKSEKEWKEILTEKEFKILMEKATEPPFTGELLYNKEEGVYVCAGCGNKVFV